MYDLISSYKNPTNQVLSSPLLRQGNWGSERMSPRSNSWYVKNPDSNSALSHSRAHTSDNEMISLSSKAPSTVQCPKHSKGHWLPFHRSWRSSSRRWCPTEALLSSWRGLRRVQRTLTWGPSADFALELYGFSILKLAVLMWNPIFHH